METEVKIRIEDGEQARQRLSAAGMRVAKSRHFEANTLYDTRDRGLARAGMLLRLREAGGKGVITWKGPGEAGPHKSRPELETEVESTETLAAIFLQLGYAPVFRYEKYRTEFQEAETDESGGLVTVDETPIGNFLEIEGPGAWIDRTAERLGFSREEYVLESYGRLYVADCERRGVEPANMVFASHE